MLIIIFILLSLTLTFSQENNAPAVELFFYSVSVSGSPIMNLSLDAQSLVWGCQYPPRYYYLTPDYNIAVYTPEYNNMPPTQAAGFDFITTTYGNPGYPVFAYGLYKVSSNRTNKYFYIDYRDDRISFYQPPYSGDMIDLWIKYEYSSDKFFYSSFGPTTNFVEIQNAQVLNFWEIKQKGNPSSYLFTGFSWQNCLLLSDKGNSCPWLIWGAYPNPNVTVLNYKVYRSVTNNVIPPPPPNYTLLTVKSSTVLTHEDTDFTFSGPFILRYKVTAVVKDASNNVYETEATNVVQTNGSFYKEASSETNSTLHQTLNNHPNPFNPATTINHSLNERGNIKLVVLNTLGEELRVLYEGFKEAGEYSLLFNSENLPSGMYICSLISSKGTTSSKMLLLR